MVSGLRPAEDRVNPQPDHQASLLDPFPAEWYDFSNGFRAWFWRVLSPVFVSVVIGPERNLMKQHIMSSNLLKSNYLGCKFRSEDDFMRSFCVLLCIQY